MKNPLCRHAGWLSLLLLAAWTTHAADLHTLWRVKGPKTTVHLAGSIHFLKPEHYPLAPVLMEAYRGSKTLVLETDMKKAQDPATAFQMLQLGSCPAGKTLKDLVKPATYAALEKYLASSPGQGAFFDAFRPWFASVTLVVLELQKQGFSPEHGLDLYFLKQAEADGKTLGALESLEFQLGLFGGLTDMDQDAFLDSTLKEIGSFQTIFAKAIEAWKVGDMARLDELLLKPMREYPALYRTFLSDRNQRWVTKIEDYLKGDQPVFIVVGAGHLAGPDSVVELLRKKGHTVEQR